MTETQTLNRGHWIVLAAAFLGWMFDGVEIGLFPLIVRPAFQNLGLTDEAEIAKWISMVVAAFLLGAAAGGIVFGWLGDTIGRVRSMVISILIYSLFTGAGALAQAPWQLGLYRFIASLGMGGEWALAVALVMECWPEKHRPKLAGAIGAASNFGFLFIALVALLKPVTQDSWRWLLLVGAAPALLALLISVLVPESERWKESVKQRQGQPGTRRALPGSGKMLLWVAIFLGFFLVHLLQVWAEQPGLLAALWTQAGQDTLQVLLMRGSVIGLVVLMACAGGVVARRTDWFVPLVLLAFLNALAAWSALGDRTLLVLAGAFLVGSLGATGSVRELFGSRLRKSTIFAVIFSSVPLIGTWAAVSGWIPTWVDQMTQIKAGQDFLGTSQVAVIDRAKDPQSKIALLKKWLTQEQWKEVRGSTARSKAWVQLVLAIGAITGCYIAPVIGGYWGRRPVYFTLCLCSLASCLYLFLCLDQFNLGFLLLTGLVGGVTAAFYGWLPLYLPELFPTRVRATGQGLSYNFGRILAALGTVYTAYLVDFFGGDYGKAMSAIVLVYVVGMVLIWFAPETKGRPLPE